MKKAIKSIVNGINSRVGKFLVNRLLPNRDAAAIGPIVFLDHLYPLTLKPDTAQIPTGEFAHPHRGIATFSYVLKGKLRHFDSRGNYDTIGAGGVQWMKSGNGIIHDEQPLPDTENGNVFHSLQFWINLPSKNKTEDPEYMAVQAEDIPSIILPDDAGVMHILIGEFGCDASPVKTFSREFIYHLELSPKSSFSLSTKEGIGYAAFVPEKEVVINEAPVSKSKIVIFENDGGEMVFENLNIKPADVFVFGGEKYMEPIVAQGPFVMNSAAEIADAYKDFFNAKYGTINYSI
ncbi:MAG TPA: pirin family protein [Chryseolinea sp.]|nr:pirin family protein [Chryseolinea sp.]